MQSNSRHHRTSPVLYFLAGFIIGVLLAGLASAYWLLSNNLPFTLENLIRLHLGNLLFLLIDAYAIVLAILFGIFGSERNRSGHARAQLQRLSRKRSAELHQLTENLQSQDQKYKELEEVISRGKQQWEATFDAVKDMIILTDESGVILRCNRATGEIFGAGFSELIGRRLDDLFMGAGEGEGTKIPSEAGEVHFPTLEGWYEVSKNFLMIDGQQKGWVYVFRDISAQKQAMQELQRMKQYYQLLVDNSPIAIVTLTLDDRIVDCNPAFEALFGFNKREAIGWDLTALTCPPHLVDETRGMDELVQQGKMAHRVTRRKHKDGSLVEVEVFGIPVISGGKQIGALALYHDVSELVAPQEERVLEEETKPEAEMVTEQQPPTNESDILPEEPALPEVVEGVDESALEAADETSPPILEEESAAEPAVVEEAGESKRTYKPRSLAIEKIEGIGPVYAQKLSQAGIRTTEDLLDHGKTRKGREELAEAVGISGVLVLKWVNMADLMRVRGIGEEYSELLEKAGVDTVRELRNRRPDNLHAALITANQMHKLVRRPPHLSEVEKWVKSAKELEPVVSY